MNKKVQPCCCVAFSSPRSTPAAPVHPRVGAADVGRSDSRPRGPRGRGEKPIARSWAGLCPRGKRSRVPDRIRRLGAPYGCATTALQVPHGDYGARDARREPRPPRRSRNRAARPLAGSPARSLGRHHAPLTACWLSPTPKRPKPPASEAEYSRSWRRTLRSPSRLRDSVCMVADVAEERLGGLHDAGADLKLPWAERGD